MNLQDRIDAAGTFGAWLCDLDGTLADTMRLHHQAYAELLSRFGGTLAWDDFASLSGPPAGITIPRFVEAAGLELAELPPVPELHEAKKDIFDELVAAGAVTPLETAELVAAPSAPDKIAIVTSGNRRGAHAIVAALGLCEIVSFIVTGDDVRRGKPDPEPYLLAAGRFGLRPVDCLVLEDHPNGLASGRAAGMTVIDVTAAEDDA